MDPSSGQNGLGRIKQVLCWIQALPLLPYIFFTHLFSLDSFIPNCDWAGTAHAPGIQRSVSLRSRVPFWGKGAFTQASTISQTSPAMLPLPPCVLVEAGSCGKRKPLSSLASGLGRKKYNKHSNKNFRLTSYPSPVWASWTRAHVVAEPNFTEDLVTGNVDELWGPSTK